MKDIKLIHGDSLQALRGYGDNYFDVAIVDPPYGLGDRLVKGGAKGGMGTMRNLADDKVTTWDDKIPPPEYFTELQRVSKNQIIWGGNYFVEHLQNFRCFIFWDKTIHGNSYADGEMAWTSFKTSAKKFDKSPNQLNRIHPTQKPTDLYKWLLSRYGKEGDRILDTHLGSGSIAIACHDLKFDLVGLELDEKYFNKATKRLKEHQSQLSLF